MNKTLSGLLVEDTDTKTEEEDRKKEFEQEKVELKEEEEKKRMDDLWAGKLNLKIFTYLVGI